MRELKALLPAECVLDGASTAHCYGTDAYTIDRSAPELVVLPRSTEEVACVVKLCVAHDVPFTPRGAGTGLSGGAMPALRGVVISLKKMTAILAVDVPNFRLQAQAGIANLALSRAVAEHGLHFAPDPSSQSVSTLGGNIAENSGGPHTLKYGVTSPHILGLTMVNSVGEIEQFGPDLPGKPGPRVCDLIVGSEGTLGIVTEAWVRLTPLPKVVKTALVAFATVEAATQCVTDIISAGVIPAALEMMDKNILVALRLAFGLEYAAGSAALLLVECDGDAAVSEMEQVSGIASQLDCLEFRVARDDAERAKLWTARKKGIGAMGRLAPTIITHDGVIPRSKLPEMLHFVYAVAAEAGIGVANLFHAGDGNLHPCFYFDDRDPAQVEAVIDAGEKIIRKCIEIGGSITGEHGVGVEKLDLMRLQFTSEDLAFQNAVKQSFLANSLCNPCKVLPDQKGCIEHMRRWRGVAT